MKHGRKTRQQQSQTTSAASNGTPECSQKLNLKNSNPIQQDHRFNLSLLSQRGLWSSRHRTPLKQTQFSSIRRRPKWPSKNVISTPNPTKPKYLYKKPTWSAWQNVLKHRQRISSQEPIRPREKPQRSTSRLPDELAMNIEHTPVSKSALTWATTTFPLKCGYTPP